ncbi:hypothetical protein BDV30DRAFT_211563 [Aspergillus minisclerotigenes]|uniref:Uncharacterized protein n=1 Tax=Aspergillus minisclerotigenes TaxID=656917 RepID=A0A5N6J4Y2_9EURO|nr:hypothetical protein BDV30DRAFT_211563 [Aspergillus minisclerotigenes]
MLTRPIQICLTHLFFFFALNLIIAPLKTHSKVFWFRAGTKSHGRSKWIHPKKKKILGDPESGSER